MNRHAWFYLFLSIWLWPLGAAASPLVADLSSYRIEIDSGFTGTKLLLFGARIDNGDIVVVVRGPEKSYTIRKKEKRAGIWVNRRSMTFHDVPDFYAYASSKQLDTVKNSQSLFTNLQVGPNTLLPMPANTKDRGRYPMFKEAFLRKQQERRLYMKEAGPVTFMGETLFKTEIAFPDTIPKGEYTAEIYLFSDGELVGMQSTPIVVEKGGFDAAISELAHKNPFVYGFLAVVMAGTIGWCAGRLFEKI